MNTRPKNPANARNLNACVIGSSGSGKTRFWLTPQILQASADKKGGCSFVVVDPKGGVLSQVGAFLQRRGYKIKVFNSIDFSKSMHYNPLAYIHSEADILKFVDALISNTKGEGKEGDPFWTKAETLLYCALIAYIIFEGPAEDRNMNTLVDMYWLMKQLQPLNCQTTIYLVKLPTWEYGKENTMTSKIAWGEVSPGEWGNYITLQEKANPVFLSACAMKWNQLQNENAPLRAMLNGKLQSVSEDIYDSFILREIAEQPEQFKMAIVIGNVLGKYQLGISDVWISNRIDKMLEDGVLEIIQDAPKGETNYRRILRKRMK